MWWLIGLAIVGIFGIAQTILESLQQEVAFERKKWEDNYQQVEKSVKQQQQIIERELQRSIETLQYSQLCSLHSASIKIADTTYGLLQGSRKTLDAMNRAIVEAAKQRKILEVRKHKAVWGGGNLEKQIIALHRLRDEILIPDKNRVKAQRDTLLQEVHKLNRQTADLRELKKRFSNTKQIESWAYGIVKWYDSHKGFGFISQLNSEQEIYFNKKQVTSSITLNQGEKVKFILKIADRPWAERITRTDF